MKFGLPIVLVGCTVVIPRGVLAWGKLGHEMVANIAWYRLSNETKSWVATVLGNVDVADTGSPLAAIASWADSVRYTQAYHWSTPLHYIDVQDDVIPGGCPVEAPGTFSKCRFEYDRDCVDNFCAAGAIANYSTRLGMASDARHSNESLKFLTHIVGDIHQPLHSSRKTDKGGNSIQVNFDFPSLSGIFIDRDGMLASHHGWNLHSIWDDGIIERAMKEMFAGKREIFEDDLYASIAEFAASGDLNLWLACGDGRSTACTSVWAEESLGTALSCAYRDIDGTEMLNGTSVTDEYYLSRLEVVKRQLVAAGVRLARTLEIIHEDYPLIFKPRSSLRPITKARQV